MSKPLRVLLTVPHLSSTAAPYRHMMALAKYLPKDQFDLTICSLRQNGYEETKPRLDQLAVPVFVARYREKISSPARFKKWWVGTKKIDAAGPFDIQHSMDFSSIPLEGIMARIRRRPYIFTQRNMIEGRHYLLQNLKFRLATRIICISDAVEHLLITQGVSPEKIRKIYNGIDIEQIESQLNPTVKKRPGFVLFVGHITARKRQEDALRAVASLTNEFPHICLGIAGKEYEPEYLIYLRQLARDLNVTNHVDFLGTRTDIPQLMQQAEALILCSKSDALPLTLLEAMSIGVPVVASEVDGNKELIVDGKSGFLVPLGNIDGYANALRILMTNAELSQSFAAEARNSIEKKYTASRVVQQTASVYLEAAEQA